MKTSEFRKLIREEVRKVIKEADRNVMSEAATLDPAKKYYWFESEKEGDRERRR